MKDSILQMYNNVRNHEYGVVQKEFVPCIKKKLNIKEELREVLGSQLGMEARYISGTFNLATLEKQYLWVNQSREITGNYFPV